MILVYLLITLLYLLFIGRFIDGFNKVSLFKLEDLPAKTKFSILIPFRNEANNLPDLLESVDALNYPKHLFEIIFIDDASEDHSVDIIKKTRQANAENLQIPRTNIQIIPNARKTNSPKKDAITTAIKNAKYDWIITTDADCILPKYWLDSFDAFIQKNETVCIAAPVSYSFGKSFLNAFQILDNLSLQGATIGGFGINKPFLCNGANFGYKKSVFKAMHGFEGNNKIASGDDIFLLEKISKQYSKQLHYLKCEKAIVKTQTQPTWRDLIAQRIRWASKTSAYNNWFGKLTGLIVLLMNIQIIIMLAITIIRLIHFKTFFYIAFIKLNIDFYLIYKSASFFNQKIALKNYIFAFVMYPFFSVFIAISSIFSGYKWKGRRFSK